MNEGPRTRDNPNRAGMMLTIDTRPLVGSEGMTVKIYYPVFGAVSDFLDELYEHVRNAVPTESYGRLWALREPNTGKIFQDMGRTWAKTMLKTSLDRRPLEQVGISPGMAFEAIPLKNTDESNPA